MDRDGDRNIDNQFNMLCSVCRPHADDNDDKKIMIMRFILCAVSMMLFLIHPDAFVPAGGRPNTINGDNWKEFLGPNGKPSSTLIVEGTYMHSYCTHVYAYILT